MILLIAVALILLAVIAPAAVRMYRRQRAKLELRGDWWPRFERELREYMSHTWRSAREAERNV